MVAFGQQRPLSHIGFDTEFRYDSPKIIIDKRNTTYDPRSIHPLLLSLAMAEPTGEDQGRLYCFVIDLRKPDIWQELKGIFWLPVCYSGHYAKVELFCLWQLYRKRSGKEPLLDLAIFKIKAVSISLSCSIIIAILNGGMMFIVPLFLQMEMGHSPFISGLVVLPVFISFIIFSQLTPRFSKRFSC